MRGANRRIPSNILLLDDDDDDQLEEEKFYSNIIITVSGHVICVILKYFCVIFKINWLLFLYFN